MVQQYKVSDLSQKPDAEKWKFSASDQHIVATRRFERGMAPSAKLRQME